MKLVNKILYIIGNGFDLYHGIASGYNDFKEFLKRKDHNLYELIRKYLPLTIENNDGWTRFKKSFGGSLRDWLDTKDELENYKEDWSVLEEALGHFDNEFLFDESLVYLNSYGAEDWSEADNYAFQSEIDKVVQACSHDLTRLFTQWVLQLVIPKPCELPRQKLNLSKDGIYLNFNYTSTLNSLYSIPEENICYIHNKAVDDNSNLILGHSWKSRAKGSLNRDKIDPDDDPRIVEGNKIIDEYFKNTFKDSKRIISDHTDFFQSLHSTENICVLGHSMSQVDDEYFREIAVSIDLSQVKWKVSWFKQEERRIKHQKLIDLGVRNDLIEFMRLREFNERQPTLSGFDL